MSYLEWKKIVASEKNFENKIKTHLKQHGCWYIKYWAGAEFTKTGIPDLLACINGRFYGIEVKAEKGKPSLLQLVNLRKIREANGYGILLYPRDFKDFVEFTMNPRDNLEWYKKNIELQNQWYNKLMR